MVLDQEWLQKMEEKFLMLVEEKVVKKSLFLMSQDQKDNSNNFKESNFALIG